MDKNYDKFVGVLVYEDKNGIVVAMFPKRVIKEPFYIVQNKDNKVLREFKAKEEAISLIIPFVIYFYQYISLLQYQHYSSEFF